MFKSENVEISMVSKEKAEIPHGLGVHLLHVCVYAGTPMHYYCHAHA